MRSAFAALSGTGERVGHYRVADDQLAVGSTLGGPKICMVIKATGAIEKVYSSDAGEVAFGTLVLHHWDERTGVHLPPLPGSFVIRPECQEHEFVLSNGVFVRETLFVLNPDPESDLAEVPAAYYVVELRNDGDVGVQIGTYAFCKLRGYLAHDVRVAYDAKLGALLAWNVSNPAHVRAFGVSRRPESYAATSDSAMAISDRCPGLLANSTKTSGSDPLGIFHLSHTLEPGESTSSSYVLSFSLHGRTGARKTYRACPDAPAALEATRAHYADVLSRSVVITPDPEVNRGVLWAKVNMLRSELRTPTGWSFVNDPTRSNNSVGRDTAWFAYGADYLTPEFSRASLLAYVERQERSGMIVEYYDVRTGESADYGLNVNDNTPLLVLALWHHYSTTGDRAFLERVYPAALKAARFLLRRRDARGLIWCTSRKTQDWGIVGWRNVIDNYRLSGATTELNSECYAAFHTVSHMARVLGEHATSAAFAEHARALREAINTHLSNPENGLYYLNIDVDGSIRTDITSDLVFPVIYGVASEETAARIIGRLSNDDFWTDAGIRTVPRDSPNYGPTHGYGLLGGVWVGVTFWFAFAAARFSPAFMAYALNISFRHYSSDPRKNNTVPGQFSEWLHGETLVNQGMMLSPWFPPRYLWAAIEGAAGLNPWGTTPTLSPRLPPDWKWLGVGNLPFRGKPLTWFAVRVPEIRTYANFVMHEDAGSVAYGEDISNDVSTDGHSSVSLGLRQGDDLALFVGNTVSRTISTAVRVGNGVAGTYGMRVFNSMRGAWVEGEATDADALRRGLPLQLERKGFCLIELRQET